MREPIYSRPPMLQAMELSDTVSRVPDEIGEEGPSALTGYDDGAPSVISRVLGWAFAVGMILLAPLFIVSLAAAFVVACLRMQQGDLGNDGSCRPATMSTARRRIVAFVDPGQFARRGNPAPTLADAHLWN